MRLCCRLNLIPNWVRLVCGVVALLLGLPIFFLPIPLGLAIIVAGLVLIYSALPRRQQHLLVLKNRAPGVYRIVRAFLERCDSCPP